MALICPSCGSHSCVASAEKNIDAAPTFYTKCTHCNDLFLEKNKKIDLAGFNFEHLKCASCGKRPLDAVMAHVLALCVKNRHSPNLTLREVGTPLLSPGIPTYAPPHLGFRSLMLVTRQKIVADASNCILDKVPEVKGILLGDTQRVVGLKSFQDQPYMYQVAGGCDLRADLVSSAYGQILIYKSQSKLHIEHDNRSKMLHLGTIPLAGCVVLDALTGPGTLGLMSVLMGARKVILNDAWLPAIKNAYLNLHVNKKLLGIKTITRDSSYTPDSWRRDHPKLFCKAATDNATIELYHGNFERFSIQDLDVDVLLIDPFPSTAPLFELAVEKISDEYQNVQVCYI